MTNLYLSEWQPREYLRQYYSTPHIAEDERANFAFAERHLARCRRSFERAVEVGCGPTLHHAMLLAPYVRELHLLDFLPANLLEVQRSLTAQAGAHDWSAYLSGMSIVGGVDRWRLLNTKIARLAEVDIRERQAPEYDLVASYYCAECVAGEREEWRRCLAGLASLVAPGGVLLLGVLRRCREYHVLGRTFPTAYVDEEDHMTELPQLGFEPATTVIEVIPVAEWAGQGFESICCVWATRH